MAGNEHGPGSDRADARPAPVDLAALARQTGGDHALEREVIALFLSKSLADLDRLKAATGAERSEVAHGLLGSARAIGAGEVARLAAAVENGAEGRIVDELAAAVAEARMFLSKHVSGGKSVRD